MQEPQNPMPQPERPWRRRSIVGPVILILLGVAFLLNNLHLVQWNIWTMVWRLWPIWLIAVGLDLMIGRRFQWGSIAVLVIVLAVAGVAVTWQGMNMSAFTVGEELTGDKIAQPVGSAKTASVTIKSSVGELRIAPGSDDNLLVDGTVQQLNGEQVTKNASGSGDHLSYTLRSNLTVTVPNFDNQHGLWDLRVNPKVAMDLDLGTGVGKSTIDLTSMTLRSLKVDSGVGELYMTLPAHGKFAADVNAGIGKVTIVIPHGMAAEVRVSTGIGHVEVLGQTGRDGRTYYTGDWGKSEDQVTIRVDGGIGEIVIDQQ